MQGLQATIVDNLTRATKDNDLIYVRPSLLTADAQLDPVVTATNLATIAPASLVKTTLPPEIARPVDHLPGRPCFEALVPYGVHLAISVYDDRKEQFVRTEINSLSDELEAMAASELSTLNLPGSIQALEQPIGLPPSLLRKAEEVRAESGPSKIRAMLADVQRVAQSDRSILDEAMKTLASEQADDEAKRAKYGTDRWTRQPSTTSNASIRDRGEKLRQTLTQAAESDSLVRRKYYDVEDKLLLLSRTKEEIEDWVPSSTRTSTTQRSDPAVNRVVSDLRLLLEELEDLESARRTIVDSARSTARSDDIRPLIMRQAGSLPAHKLVSAADFEPIFEKEMIKYQRYVTQMRDSGIQQEDLLRRIRSMNEAFVQTRREDRTVKARQEAFQDLDKAYQQYRELCSNLAEGLQFYAQLGKMIGQVRDSAQALAQQRRAESIELERALRAPDFGEWNPQNGIKFG